MKFDFFKEKTQPLVGVDISASSVKMVELSTGSKGGYHLEGYAIASLAKDAVVDGNIAGLEQVADAVKRAWKLLGSREKRTALALPAAAVISKKVLMPGGLREEEMELQVEGEANQYIPFSLDEVNIDFQVLGPATNSPDEVEVLIAASRKEKIEDRVAAVEGAGLKALVVDVETYVTEAAYTLIANQLPNHGREQTVMIVDIGAVMTHINVLHDNQSVYIREQTFGGGQLTQEIQRRFGLTPEEAEISKRKGGLPESYESEVMQPFMQTLALEVARALQFFTSSTQYNRVDHIILAGGCAAIPGIDALVQERTQVNAIIANPFAGMTINPKIKQQQLVADAPSLLIACGLAMRGVDA
ncbi:pilus assembly protein PilM [Methylovorus mays]|uniref:pilus assembly protein PilM n=1 Tax=Methylovorus mays TaxID=184077 RepID=UPI001E4ED451|nr:pilus assembly protein PilM [Methylovorus mays]MCB5208026.1 pilus assembly protein PilM [Methylovorus mays]